ncbi:MAG: transcriptional regulator GlxA family with amidase domain [Motiliproteus sp.]|jgi:transcriptional regulator GlxA family with amidase domain
MPKPTLVAVIAFDRISPFHLSVPCVVFGEVQTSPDTFELQVCSAEGKRLRTTAGYEVVVEHGLEMIEQADILIVPSWRDPNERPPQLLLDALVAAHQRGAQVVGLCLGAYVLAEAGLLDGGRATTHWAYSEDFSRRYPRVLLNPDVLYIDEGRIITSAGTAAGIDCCLHMLREKLGAELANRAARRLVVPPHRQGGQAQFIDQPLPAATRDSSLTELIDWVRANLRLAHSLDSLAEHGHMSRRTFTRHFRQITGIPVKKWLLNERLSLCQRMLETSDCSIESVADHAGFGSVISMRQQFRQAFGLTPTAWRKSFKGQ